MNAPICQVIILSWAFYKLLDRSAPTCQVIALSWAFYKLLDQFAPTGHVVVWWVQFTLNLVWKLIFNPRRLSVYSLGVNSTAADATCPSYHSRTYPLGPYFSKNGSSLGKVRIGRYPYKKNSSFSISVYMDWEQVR